MSTNSTANFQLSQDTLAVIANYRVIPGSVDSIYSGREVNVARFTAIRASAIFAALTVLQYVVLFVVLPQVIR